MTWIRLVLWVMAGCLVAQPVWGQRAMREFYRKSMSSVFNPATVVEEQGRRAVDALIQYLEANAGGNAGMAYSALQQLARTGHPKAVAILSRYLEENSPIGPQWQLPARGNAIDGLALMDTPEARRALARALGSAANKIYHSNIVKHCGRLQAKECSAALVEHIRNDKMYHEDTLINLALCSAEAVVKLVAENLKTRSHPRLSGYEITALGIAGKPAAGLLLDQFTRHKPRTWSGSGSASLAWALGEVDDQRVLPLLRDMVQAKDPGVVYFAALSLARYGDRQSLPLVRAASALELKRDSEYIDGGSDSDWGHFRRERIRQIEFNLGLAYARTALGDPQARAVLRQGADSRDGAAAMLADAFLLNLGDQAAASRLTARIETEARKGFSAVTTDTNWTESLGDAFLALSSRRPRLGLRVAMLLASASHWMYKEMGSRSLSNLPEDLRVRTLVEALGEGSYASRLAVKEQLRFRGEAMLAPLRQAAPKLDLDGRSLAVSLLGEFDDGPGLRVLKKLARSDPAWQIRMLAREAVALREGREWPERPRMGRNPGDYVRYGEPDGLPSNPVGAAELRGRVFLAGKQGLSEYDGYQWRASTAQGLCTGEITAIAGLKNQLYVFTRKGVAVGDGSRFRCRSWAHPVVSHVLADRTGLLLGTAKGLVRFDGKKVRTVSGSPERGVTAISRQGETLWVGFELPALQPGVRQQPVLARTMIPPRMPPALYRLERGKFTPVVEPLLSFEGYRLPMDVLALAAGPRGTLYVGCNEGILVFDGRRWDLLDERQGYDPRYGVDGLHVSDDGVLTALQGIWLDQRDAKGKWHRVALGDENYAQALMMARRGTSTLLRSNGDVWLVLGDFMQATYKMMPGVAVRLAGPRPSERALPPETLFVMAKAGEWRWENPETRVQPPNVARIAGKPEPIEVPAAQASIEAAAQDPWDYEGVEFQFKLDERPWGEWQAANGILTPLMGEGEHLVRVRGRDRSGNVDPTPAVLHFTVHTREVAVVRILDGNFKKVFPAQHRRYEREGVGQVEVENRATEPLNLKLNLKVRDLFDTPSTRSITVPPGGKKKVSLVAPFNDKVLDLQGGAEVQAIVEVEFEFEGIQRQVRRSFPMTIHAANAFDWSDPARLAGFINSSDPAVEKVGAAVFRAFTGSPGATVLSMRNLALAAYLFRALDALGVRYKPDPDSPFSAVKPGRAAMIDTIRFPGQTLQQKVGDCDDLVVLYASLLEQVGIRAAVVPVEGHVFLMFDTGVLEGNRSSFQVPDDLLVGRKGSLWAPVEVTFLGRKGTSFDAAWSAGAEAYKTRYRPRPEAVVDVREAWASTPPVVHRMAKPLAVPDRVASAGREEVNSLIDGYRQAILAKVPAGEDAASLLGRGRLLAKNGLFQEAEGVLKQAAAREKSFEVIYALGVVHAGIRKNREAVDEFQQATRLARDNQQKFRATIALATTWRTAGKMSKAREACDQALKFNPAARFDSKYSAMIRFLRSSQKTKASSETGPPPFIQALLSEM